MEISPETLPIASYEINTNDDPTLETISLTLFVVGCVRKCLGCQNPEIQQLTETNHTLFFLDEIQELIENRLCLISSVCFCGGDFLPTYKIQLKKLVDFCKTRSLRTILYTGELFENIDEYFKNNIDIIIDGPYDQMKKNNGFPASSNQRCWMNGKIMNNENLEINKGVY